MYALIVIDMQNDFVARIPIAAANILAANINALFYCFRARKLPIYVVVTEHEPDGGNALRKAREEKIIPAVRDTPGARLFDKLTVPAEAARVVKAKYSAFFDTALSGLMGDFSGFAVIAGVNTHACIRATAVDASQRDMGVIIPSDAVASYDEAYHRDSLRYLGARIGRVAPTAEIIRSVCEEHQ